MQGAASFIGTRGKTVADAYPERYLYYQGDAAKIRVKTADYSGKPVSERVTLKFIEQKYEKVEKEVENNGYKYKDVNYILHERELASADVNTDTQGAATYEFMVPSPGSIYVKAIVVENGKEVVNRGGSFWARDKMLKLDIVPNKKEFKPRDVASYTILARNEDGSPAANAEVSLGIVDEAIYSIQAETAGNIKRDFYGKRFNEVQTSLAIHYTFTGYAGEKPVDLAKNKSSYQLADFKNESSFAEPTIRKEFKDTAFWQPQVLTGDDGKATVSFKLPDNLTTWRATARGVTADTRVGSAMQKTIARKAVIMRLEMPRFLTEGDTVTISGVVHNFLKSDKSTKISLDLNGAQLLDSPSETR